jgi:hypothetical protein
MDPQQLVPERILYWRHKSVVQRSLDDMLAAPWAKIEGKSTFDEGGEDEDTALQREARENDPRRSTAALAMDEEEESLDDEDDDEFYDSEEDFDEEFSGDEGEFFEGGRTRNGTIYPLIISQSF